MTNIHIDMGKLLYFPRIDKILNGVIYDCTARI